jgi:phosphatidylglycerophosphate synthase
MGLTANQVTIGGFFMGMAACLMLAMNWYLLALLLIGLNRLADGLDGTIARLTRPTHLGSYLDITLDFLFYAGVPFFFAVGQPHVSLAACFLVFSFVGTGSSFLAFAVLAAKLNLSTERRGKKGIYYLGGLTEGSETIACFVLAWVFGGLCWLTTMFRIIEGIRAFR